MSSTCPGCEMKFTRRHNMKRHFHSRHESMKATTTLLLLLRRKHATTILLRLLLDLQRKHATTILLLLRIEPRQWYVYIPPPKETRYDNTPPSPPPPEEYVDTPPTPPPPPQEGYVYTPPSPCGSEFSSLQHQTETEEPYFIYSAKDPFVFKVPNGRLQDHFIYDKHRL